MATPTQQLLDVKLGDESLEAFVRSRRSANRSWRLIARDLYEQTGIDVTFQSLRTWFPDDQTAEATS